MASIDERLREQQEAAFIAEANRLGRIYKTQEEVARAMGLTVTVLRNRMSRLRHRAEATGVQWVSADTPPSSASGRSADREPVAA